MESHRSHPLTKEDLFRADEIVVMERRHRGYIREHYPEFSTKVTLLLQEGERRAIFPIPRAERWPSTVAFSMSCSKRWNVGPWI